MNSITQALTTAGVKIPPQNQRIWQWLKDNGPHGTRDLASELKIGEDTVQAAISTMIQRRMLEKVERMDHKGARLNNHYAALGKTFVLLPKPAKKAATANGYTEVFPVAKEAPAADRTPEQLLATCTLTELRGVYAFLKGIFK